MPFLTGPFYYEILNQVQNDRGRRFGYKVGGVCSFSQVRCIRIFPKVKAQNDRGLLTDKKGQGDGGMYYLCGVIG